MPGMEVLKQSVDRGGGWEECVLMAKVTWQFKKISRGSNIAGRNFSCEDPKGLQKVLFQSGEQNAAFWVNTERVVKGQICSKS